MAIAPQRLGIGLRRHFTTPGVHPYDEVRWERRDARITNFRDGSVAFEQLGVEVPEFWSINATNILAQKYFRGTMGTPERESSLRQVVDRVVDTLTAWGLKDGYFLDDEEAETFRDELKYLIVHQRAAFNSPVWFNIGVPGVPAQGAACFILSVEDSMDSILNWYREEGIIFKGGSGAGVNLSRIRSSKELLQGGGTASGPVSFMRGADASAGTIKSGGKTRRAAKMVILDVDHPDIEDFIWCKAIEERKARVLRDAGFDMDLDGADSYSVQYQNANNSVRVTDEFMQAVLDDADWDLVARTDGRVLRTVKARQLFRQLAEAAWECADPGMQFDTTINDWHTASNTGRINGSNPCSEYMHLDNSACNLASLNLLTFLSEDGTFDVEGFKAAVEVVFTGQEILVGNADYPTPAIAETARRFRELGLGYANLGALLMAQGLPYDSDAGRAWAAAITALMTGHAYATSARTAARLGPFAGYHDNVEPMQRVLRKHQAEAAKIDEDLVPTELLSAAQQAWDEAVELAERYGVRNSQASVLAPTGCLVGGTLVPTERGLARLGSLGDPEGPRWQELKTAVATDEGPREATRFYVNGSEPVVRLTTRQGYELRGTATHRVKVVDRSDGSWHWRRLAEVRPGDLVPLALGRLVGQPAEVSLGSPVAMGAPGEVAIPDRLSAELAEFLGFVTGVGRADDEGIVMTVPAEDFDVAERLERLAKEVFHLAPEASEDRHGVTLRLASRELAHWCRQADVVAADGRPLDRVPDAVLRANDPEVYAAFLRGLFEAAGDTVRGCPVLLDVPEVLGRDVQSILLTLGFVAAVTEGAAPGAGKVHLRVLPVAGSGPFGERIGFVGGRKQAKVRAEALRSSWHDPVPVVRRHVDRLDPRHARLRHQLVAEVARGVLSRPRAAELLAHTRDPEVAHLLSFFYDTVEHVGLGPDEATFDLSVPQNVTYLANGFVSHNTIGLLMDCDTTGIEPDLSLVKTKKLVGGGNMSIVNQTVPRALARLGYAPEEVEDILGHIDTHKSIVGAPHLRPEHVAVFACSMGDNTIHYSGHVTMMGAVQPFISGAISKTINMPEDVTVDDVEQLHLDAWRLGIKAVAIYRDNCKVAQPLATTKKEPSVAAASEAERRALELGDRVVELESALAQERARAREPVVVGAVRERLPRRRRSNTFAFRVADCEGYVTVGEYEDGRPGEVFIKVSKQGSTLAGIMDAFSISVSLGLQHQVPLATYVRKYTNMKFEPAGITDDADLRIATSLVDYIFRRLALDYLSLEEREELGVLSTSERLQPTLPGVEELTTPSRGVVDPPGTSGDLAPEGPSSRAEQRDAPFCYSCGNVMQRAGSCYVCAACGSTSGCS